MRDAVLLSIGPAEVPDTIPGRMIDSLLAKELLVDDDVLLCTRDRRTTTASRKPFDLVPVEKRPGRDGQEEGEDCASEAYFQSEGDILEEVTDEERHGLRSH